jgi:hypothetical protein
MQNSTIKIKTYLCPISHALGKKMEDFHPSDSMMRAANILRTVASLAPSISRLAPQKLAIDPSSRELLILRNLNWNINSHSSNTDQSLMEKLLIDLIAEMHAEFCVGQTDKSALSRFGALVKNFQEVLQIHRPDLKFELELNVLAKEHLN